MNGTRRWVDEGAPDAVRQLFEAGRDERPSAASLERAVAAVGVGTAVALGTSQAAGAAAGAAAKGAASGGTLTLALKWSLIGAVGAATTVGAVHGVAGILSPSPPVVAAEAPKVAAARHVSEQPPVPVRAEDVAPAAAAEPSPAVRTAVREHAPVAAAAAAPPAVDDSRMLAEVQAIDRARSALARGDHAGTVAAVDAYRAAFSPARFEPEALYLRMEALRRSGDAAGARAVADRLLGAYPSAPQAASARQLVSGERR